MSETGDETPAAAPLSSREFMEMDLDLDAASWPPFDQIAAFVSSPLPPFFISSPQSLLHFSFPPQPPSPVWLFEDRSPANSPKAVHGCSDTSHNTNGNMKREEGGAKLLQMATAEENSIGSHAIKERMSQALRYVKESIDRHILAQVWAPVKNGDRYVLTTSGQPFVLDPQSTRLLQYRMVSVSYMFSVDEDNDMDLGLPGRVFKRKLPEWTPNVQYYSRREYLRLNHALQYDVQGTLALPVFEPSGQTCVGVVELIMTSQKIHYASEVDKVCKALEAVNLKSSEISGRHPNVQICNEGRQAALAEILEILTVVCEAHKLPLAQTWVPCMHRSVMAHGGGLIKSCSSFDGSCMGKVCMSTTDAAFYVVEPHMWGFRDACVEHHLQKGQGVAGRAFESHRPWFCRDVTQFNKVQYPLVHYARMFGLASCLAICLQSTRSGEDDYILEFFLPSQCKDASEQQALLDSISTVMRKYSRSLKVITELNLEEGLPLEVIEMLANEYHEPKPTSPEDNPEGLGGSQNEGDAVPISQEHLVTDAVVVNNGNGTPNPALCNKNNGIQLRKRGKAEKSISLEVLQRYFAGSLKDAAKSLGVCPTTMKRICRQHGISRWPSRKINKVNRSLSKLKRVMESVHGAEGAFDLTNLPLAAGSSSFPDFDKDPSPRITDDRESQVIVGNELDLDRNSPQAEKESDCSKTRSSSEGSVDGSGGQQKGKCMVNPLSSPILEENGAMTGEPESSLLGRMLIEESGSSKDLRDLCNNSTRENEPALGTMQDPSQAAAIQEPRMVTIKASYKEDIIRFRIHCTAALVALNDEVAKRLKLEVGTFDVKYLDDDHEWVVLACDGDLEECMEISSLSGAHLIRLTVDDVATNLGSSSGST